MAIKDCDLLERVAWVDDAVSALDIGMSALSCYLIKDGYIHATNGRMIAATPFPFDLEGSWLVPAEAFAKVLKNRPEGDFEWFSEPGQLILKRGRFKGKIKTLPEDQWVYDVETPPRSPLPPDFLAAVRRALPFCSENATKPWATCLLISGDAVWASNNVVVAKAPFTYAGTADLLLPRWAAEFITQREKNLDGWWWTGTSATFTWSNGSWMRTSLVDDKFPPVSAVIDQYAGDCPFPITPTWRKALQRVSKITGDAVVRLRQDGVYSASGEVLTVEDDAETPVPEGLTETVWDMRFLDPVISNATHWDPMKYPNPAPWLGEGISGIILGRRD